MQSSSDLGQPNREAPDYTGDRFLAKQLVDRLQKYYLDRGFTQVKVWLEGETTGSGRKFWNVRSNIVFDCNSLLHNTAK